VCSSDLSSLDEEELRAKIAESRLEASDLARTRDFNALWRFYHDIKVGDKIIARRGRMKMLAVGTVKRQAYYDEPKGRKRVGGPYEYYPNFIDVEWEETPKDFDTLAFAMSTLTGPFDEDYYRERIEREVGDEHENESETSYSFKLEKYLEDFVITNMGSIFQGRYELYVDGDGVGGKEYPVFNDDGKRMGRIDILAKDKSDDSLLVIELKRDQSSDETVGQVLRYMGWVKQNLDERVKGLVICSEKDEGLRYALQLTGDLIDLKYYAVNFRLSDSPSG
jgi:restriction system protein